MKPFMKKKKKKNKDEDKDLVFYPHKMELNQFFDDGYDRDGYDTQTPGTSLPATFIPSCPYQGTTSRFDDRRINMLKKQARVIELRNRTREACRKTEEIGAALISLIKFTNTSEGFYKTANAKKKRIVHLKIRTLYASIQGLEKEFDNLKRITSDIEFKIKNMIKDKDSASAEIDEEFEKNINEMQSIWKEILLESEDLKNHLTKVQVQNQLGWSIERLLEEICGYDRLTMVIGEGPDRKRLGDTLSLIDDLYDILNSIQRNFNL